MSASQTLGGPSRTGRVIGPSLDKIIKNAAWRKHAHLVATCKAALDRLEAVDAAAAADPASPLLGVPLLDAEFVLQPLILALDTASAKVIEPTLDCAYKLFSFGLVRGEIDKPDAKSPSNFKSHPVLFRLLDAMSKVCSVGEEAVEVGVLRVFLAAVRSPCLLVRGDCLAHMVRTCYNVYLGGVTGTNQICAKAVLAQIMVIVFTRVEEDSMNVPIRTVSVAELLEVTDKNLSEGSSVSFCQGFINEVMNASEGVGENKQLTIVQNGNDLEHKDGSGGGGSESGSESGGDSKLREDGFLIFRNLCKLSMKYSSQENADDQILLRGKILSLELLKVIMDNGGPIWRLNERFLNAIKQYLCLSLLKNSALSVMAVFQFLCCIFLNLVTKYRSGLKAEIGIFFPMLVLRVLENVLQPSYIQKMTVLNLLEKISQDSQISIDIFVNYDCDVDAPNIFERTVNGLLKTALGPPSGSTTTLSAAQDITFRHESVKCLVTIIKSMGVWMDQQLRVGDTHQVRTFETDITEHQLTPSGEEGIVYDYDLHTEVNCELSDAATLEQRRAYKIELQKGISLFNRKPAKGIEFLINTKKVGGSPEEVAAFLKNTSGLNETVIGSYLGEREEFPLKVMHAYVDSFNFEGIDFGEAIRFFLRGFRLPGEAQKIDRIMEKFAERYCKCNPSSFATADTAYVLAYSVIMLNTDAHNNMVKEKMTKADFIKNNRGIDNGKDLPEDYLGTIYDQIVKNEIKIIADSSEPQSKQANSFNKLLGFDGILNLVSWKQTEEKPLGANGVLIRHIQEQFKAKSAKSESIYHAVTDPAILRFMVEVSWGPMLAAFSVTLDESDDKLATAQCLLGFRYAVHVTAMMGMQTQRDAFVTSIAKFTFLHCAADMKQKNVDAVKAIILIAIEDGNYLHDAWEHILTCLSRIEHLQLLGEGSPSDASFLSVPSVDFEEKTPKSVASLKKKGSLQNPAVLAVVRGGSYDSTSLGSNTQGQLTPVQISNFISNLNLLEQIGNFELNQVFAHSQRLNSDAIVAFVRALCKVSISELQSPTDPRVFSLTKIVEIAHYNMNRIRLVWSRIWNVLSDFFVSVGLSENLSVAIFVMDSLRQLAMKFLEREELANYNFQNEFLRPFVIVMQKSNSTEIRELIVRCISQMVLGRVSNVKSGWKSVFMIFTTAAADERKNVVLLAFETMEKIVREYFPYITETETMTFTDCVKCLLTFTNSRFNTDVSLNAIAFLRFCAVKLAEGGLVCNEKSRVDGAAISLVTEDVSDLQAFTDKDDHASFWVPLLTGLSKLTSEPRSAIRKTALEVLFDILKDHGHLFTRPFWVGIINSVIFPIFRLYDKEGNYVKDEQSWPDTQYNEASTWDPETSAVASQCLVDLFVKYFDAVRAHLPGVVSIMTGFIRSALQGPASTGVNALVSLAGGLGNRLSEDDWRFIFLALKEAAESTLSGYMKIIRTMDNIEVPDSSQANADTEMMSDHELTTAYLEDDNLQTAAYVVARTKTHISVQLLIIQVITDLCKTSIEFLSHENISILLEIFCSITTNASQLNSETVLQKKLHKVCSILELSGPPIVHFENDTYQNFLNFLQDLLMEYPALSEKIDIESQTVSLCEKILKIYLNCTSDHADQLKPSHQPAQRWILPLPVARKEELAARTPLVVSAIQVLCSLERESFRRYVSRFFPLLVDLVRCEHTSGDVQLVLSNMFQSCIGPIVMN